jgi:(2R)-sulfolactate sulfo-lyase subunit alpha
MTMLLDLTSRPGAAIGSAGLPPSDDRTHLTSIQLTSNPTDIRDDTMSIPHLLVHDAKDTVGVVVVEDLKAGTDMTCVVTADNSAFALKAKMDVPIGHKIALTDIKAGDTVWKYGQDIGKAVAPIAKGEHVHVHNLKTKRW